MITPNILAAAVVLDAALILYAFLDNQNRNYTHVLSSLISLVLSGVIAYTFMFNLVGVLVVTGGTATWEPFTDPMYGYFFVFVAVVMIIYTILSALEAIAEPKSSYTGYEE